MRTLRGIKQVYEKLKSNPPELINTSNKQNLMFLAVPLLLKRKLNRLLVDLISYRQRLEASYSPDTVQLALLLHVFIDPILIPCVSIVHRPSSSTAYPRIRLIRNRIRIRIRILIRLANCVYILGPNNGKYATLSKQCKTLEANDFY